MDTSSSAGSPTDSAAGTGRRGGPPWPANLTLLRPANLPTAWADILAGAAVAGGLAGTAPLGWLLLATTGLCGGGIVLNDVFDANLDRREDPERPIPSGRASRRLAAGLGLGLLVAGVAFAGLASTESGALAVAIALLALTYDAVAKHHAVAGPLVIGLCRGGNLLLGVSAAPALLTGLPLAASPWPLALIPMAYIGAIALVSRGAVHGVDRLSGQAALLLIGGVTGALPALATLPAYDLLPALPFAAMLAWRVVPPFVMATRDPHPVTIRRAVQAGVLSLIVLDATLAAGFGGFFYGVAVLLLLPLSLSLSRTFAVT